MKPRKVGRPNTAASGDLTEIIVETGMAMFLEKGFSVTTIDAIVAKARTSKVTFYSRFKSKAELLERGIEHMGETIIYEGSTDVDMGLPFPQRLEALGERLLEMVLLPYTIALDRLATAESYRFPQIAQIAHKQGTTRIMAVIRIFLEDAVQRGDLKTIDVDLMTEVYIDMLLSFARRAAHRLGSMTFDEAARQRLTSINRLLFAGYVA